MLQSHRQANGSSSVFSVFFSRRFRFLLIVACFFIFVTAVLTSASFYIRSLAQQRNAVAVIPSIIDTLASTLPTTTTTTTTLADNHDHTTKPTTKPTSTHKHDDATADEPDVPHEIHDHHDEHTHAEDDAPDSHSHVFDTGHGHTHEQMTPAQLERQRRREEETRVMAAKCQKLAKEYGIEQGKTWGTAQDKAEVKQQWGDDDCDTHLALHSYEEYIAAHPELTQPIVVPADRVAPPAKLGTVPLISVCICTTTRGLSLSSMEELTLFKQLLPSIADFAEEGYEYNVYLLYDIGDSYFDKPESVKAVEAWFDKNVVKPLTERKIVGRLVLCRYDNQAKKPGPAFNYITHLAYIDGSDYIYRINDDTYFVSPYTSHFIAALQAMGPPYGAVGPLCREGNTYILTHDFVHRLHHELMQGWHYPPTLTDWWMDDWISRVYGRQRTQRVDQVIVKHMMLSHGTRYSVTWEHSTLVGTEVELGRQKIERYMERHNMTKELDAYQKDEFKFTMHGPGLHP